MSLIGGILLSSASSFQHEEEGLDDGSAIRGREEALKPESFSTQQYATLELC